MKKILLLLLILFYSISSKTQIIFEFDTIEFNSEYKNEKKEIYGKIIIDSDTNKIVTEYNGIMFNDIISKLLFTSNHNTRVIEYCYSLNEKELLHIFKYNDKIYSIVISSTVNHKNYTIYTKKYL
jgi:hypothetical protein